MGKIQRRRLSVVLGGAAFAAFTNLPVFADSSAGCALLVDGDKVVDIGALCRMGERLAASGRAHAVLVSHAGELVFEQYFKGPDEVPGLLFGRRVATVNFDAATLHDMKSVTKSIASLALGIMIDRGLVRGVDEPIFDFFPELSDLRTPEKDRILLKHVLSMTAGLEWQEATADTGDFFNDEARMNMASNACRYVLSRALVAPAGQTFHYSTGALALVAAIVRKATGQHLDEFARENLFAPLGIADVTWDRVRGETDAGGGLRLRPRDMVKMGQLVLSGGRWKDKQIVSQDWIQASTATSATTPDGQTYGYLWWGGRASANRRSVRWVGALGRGGQSIRIVPELDLVIAVTAGYYQDYSPQAFQAQYGVFKDVLQAVSGSG